MSRSLETMRQNIIQAMDNVISNLNMRRMAISTEGRQVRREVLDVPTKEREMLSISRQQKVKENLYLYLLNKREENALSLAISSDNARIYEPPSGSRGPVYPNLYKKLLMGAGCGVALPAIILLLMLMLDTRVYTRKDIEDRIDVSFLAEIPQMEEKKGEDGDVMVRAGGRDSLSKHSVSCARIWISLLSGLKRK